MTDWIPIIGVLALVLVLTFFLGNYLMKLKKRIKEKAESEGIQPPENLAGFVERAVAFVIDIFIFSLIFNLSLRPLNIGNEPFESNPIFVIAFIVGWCFYYVVLVRWFGNTAGKKLFGLRIVSANTKPLTLWRIFLRAFFLITIDPLLFGFGYWVILINKKRQGVHDDVAKTYVVKVKKG